jgi:dTDP-4-amino-4,6-dideoxygalactose transaminase
MGTSVVVPGFDWPAAAAAAASLGARVVPVDVCRDAFLVDPEAVRRSLDRTTRAVVATHLAGVPAPVERLRDVCAQAGVVLIEDCCQALGAKTAGEPVGKFGAAAVFSLGPGKLVDAGEGGVLVTNDDLLHREAVRLTQHPVRQLRTGLVPSGLALAARLHPLAAIIGLASLEDVHERLAAARAEAAATCAVASEVAGVRIISERAGETFAWPCVPAAVTRDAKAKLMASGVHAEPLGAQDIGRLVASRRPLRNVACAGELVHRLQRVA